MPSSTVEQQNYSGFLGGFRSNNNNKQQDAKHRRYPSRNINVDDLEEAMSIVSVATSKNFYTETTTKNSKKHSSALSVVSDLSNTSTSEDDFAGTHEFVLKCKNDDMVFVSSIQGRMIKQRCRHFRLLLSAGGGSIVVGGETKDNSTTSSHDNRILDKSTWSAGTARHVIELLTEGTTWIDNSSKHYKQLAAACDEMDVKLCLGSLINYHDLIDQRSTKKFFKLVDIKHFQFKFKAVVLSQQWLHLLQDKNILLMANTKVLMITVAPPGSKNPDGGSITSPSPPNQDRLKKCDNLCSEFCVYSQHGSKLNALLTILDVLQKGVKETSNDKRKKQVPAEHFKISYQTRVGSIQEEHLNMLWRLTSASYTLATVEERKYLKNDNDVHSVHTAATVPTSHHDSDHSETSITSDEEASPIPTVKRANSRTLVTTPTCPPKFQYRTITGTSPMVLRNLFDPLNGDSDKTLPASISVTNPSPDTLGRFLNAAAENKGGSKSVEIGFDLVDKTTTVFYVSSTSDAVKQVVQYLSNYEHPAAVDSDNFVLQQYTVGGNGN